MTVAGTRSPEPLLDRISSWVGPAALAAVLAAVAVALRGLALGDAGPARLLGIVLLSALLALALTRGRSPLARATATVFLAALALRLLAVLVLDEWTLKLGGPFVASPDAAGYDYWARRLFESWSTGEWPDIRRHDMAGRWGVGFEHVLAAAYGIFGPTALLGQTLGAVFGALAALFFWLTALELVPGRVAVWAGVAYALWPSSVAWSAFSVLRDSLIWALLYAATWCALRVIRGRVGAVFSVAFGGAFLALRLVRPYGAILLAAGLGLAFGLALVARRQGIARPALLLGFAMLAAETLLAATGFPSAVRTAVSAVRKDAALHRWSDFEAPPKAAPGASGEADFGLTSPGAPGRGAKPATSSPRPGGRFLKVSVAGNVARFVFGPLAWVPTGPADSSSLDWLLPGMWFWYAVLPLAAVGFLVGLARLPAFRPVAAVALALGAGLAVAGEGTFFRQREMLVPVVLLAGAIGLDSALRRPRALALMAAAWVLFLGTGIACHLHMTRGARAAPAGAARP